MTSSSTCSARTLFMNFRVVDEHGRQLGHRRATWARSRPNSAPRRAAPSRRWPRSRWRAGGGRPGISERKAGSRPTPASPRVAPDTRRTRTALDRASSATPAGPLASCPSCWRSARARQTLIGYPALIDAGDAVTVEVFDEPQAARGAATGQAVAPAVRAADHATLSKYLEKNIPELQKMAAAYMQLGKAADAAAATLETARADHRGGAGAGFSAGTRLPTRSRFQAPGWTRAGRRPDRDRGGAAGAPDPAEYAVAARKISRHQAGGGGQCRCRAATARLLPQTLSGATPWRAAARGAPDPEAITLRLDKAARRPGARRPAGWPSCCPSSNATGGCRPAQGRDR